MPWDLTKDGLVSASMGYWSWNTALTIINRLSCRRWWRRGNVGRFRFGNDYGCWSRWGRDVRSFRFGNDYGCWCRWGRDVRSFRFGNDYRSWCRWWGNVSRFRFGNDYGCWCRWWGNVRSFRFGNDYGCWCWWRRDVRGFRFRNNYRSWCGWRGNVSRFRFGNNYRLSWGTFTAYTNFTAAGVSTSLSNITTHWFSLTDKIIQLLTTIEAIVACMHINCFLASNNFEILLQYQIIFFKSVHV